MEKARDSAVFSVGLRTLRLLRNYHDVSRQDKRRNPHGDDHTTCTPWMGTSSARRPRPARGEPVPHVTARFGMGRSILYKWRRRALTALQGALTDQRPGPQCPPIALSRAGTTARGAGPAPSDLECGADPRQGRLRRAVTPYHSRLPIAARCRASPTAGPLSARPALTRR